MTCLGFKAGFLWDIAVCRKDEFVCLTYVRCTCACVIQMLCTYICVKYLLWEQFVDKWVAMVCIMGSLLSRDRFAALLSLGITFLSHKFACIAMPASLLSLSSTDNFFFGDQNGIPWHWETDMCFNWSYTNVFESKIFRQSSVSTRGFFCLADWLDPRSRLLEGLYCRAYASYLLSIIDGCMMWVRCNFCKVVCVRVCVGSLFYKIQMGSVWMPSALSPCALWFIGNHIHT